MISKTIQDYFEFLRYCLHDDLDNGVEIPSCASTICWHDLLEFAKKQTKEREALERKTREEKLRKEAEKKAREEEERKRDRERKKKRERERRRRAEEDRRKREYEAMLYDEYRRQQGFSS